jgi:hypothetical protein
MKNNIILLALFMLFCLQLQARPDLKEQLNNAKFQLIKSSIEFLAADKKKFPLVSSQKCNNCKGYADLEEFIKENNLTEVQELLNEWKKFPIDTSSKKWKAGLKNLKKRILETILRPGREYRSNLPDYKAYEKKLDSIIDTVDPYKPAATPGNPQGNVVKNNKQYVIDSLSKRITMLEKESNSFPVWSVVFFITSISLGWLVIRKSKRHSKEIERLDAHLKREQKDKLTQVNELLGRIRIMEEEIMEMQKLPAMTDERSSKERGNKQQQPVLSKEKMITEARDPAIKTNAAPVKQENNTLYAKYADLGNGFSVNELLQEEDDETIFTITILSPGTAQFTVNNNLNAQKYALSNAAYFLDKTCESDSLPLTNSRIITKTPGVLQLQGNKWLIVHLAKISYS